MPLISQSNEVSGGHHQQLLPKHPSFWEVVEAICAPWQRQVRLDARSPRPWIFLKIHVKFSGALPKNLIFWLVDFRLQLEFSRKRNLLQNFTQISQAKK